MAQVQDRLAGVGSGRGTFRRAHVPTSSLLSTGFGSWGELSGGLDHTVPCTPRFPTSLESKEGWWQVLCTARLYPLIPTNWFVPPVTLYYELAPRGKTTLRPVTSQGPSHSR